MSTYTSNLNLIKPELTDKALITPISENFEIIDEAVGDLQKSVDGYSEDYTVDTSNTNILLNNGSTITANGGIVHVYNYDYVTMDQTSQTDLEDGNMCHILGTTLVRIVLEQNATASIHHVHNGVVNNLEDLKSRVRDLENSGVSGDVDLSGYATKDDIKYFVTESVVDKKINDNTASLTENLISYDPEWESGKIDISTGDLTESSDYEETTKFIELSKNSTITASGTSVDVYSYNVNTNEYIGQIADMSDGEVYTASEKILVRITCGQNATVFIKIPSIKARVEILEEKSEEYDTYNKRISDVEDAVNDTSINVIKGQVKALEDTLLTDGVYNFSDSGYQGSLDSEGNFVENLYSQSYVSDYMKLSEGTLLIGVGEIGKYVHVYDYEELSTPEFYEKVCSLTQGDTYILKADSYVRIHCEEGTYIRIQTPLMATNSNDGIMSKEHVKKIEDLENDLSNQTHSTTTISFDTGVDNQIVIKSVKDDVSSDGTINSVVSAVTFIGGDNVSLDLVSTTTLGPVIKINSTDEVGSKIVNLFSGSSSSGTMTDSASNYDLLFVSYESQYDGNLAYGDKIIYDISNGGTDSIPVINSNNGEMLVIDSVFNFSGRAFSTSVNVSYTDGTAYGEYSGGSVSVKRIYGVKF